MFCPECGAKLNDGSTLTIIETDEGLRLESIR